MVVDASSMQSGVMKGMVIALYFLPLIVAWLRGHHNKASIFLLNLFLGWTVIGWIVALIWSASAIKQKSSTLSGELPTSGAGKDGAYLELEKLAELRERGHLTAEEFEAEKAKVLNR